MAELPVNLTLPDGLEVEWDRAIDLGETITIYRWIERPVAAKIPARNYRRFHDFLLVELDAAGAVKWWCTTSAKWSLRIHLAFGGEPDDHSECQTIAEAFENWPAKQKG